MANDYDKLYGETRDALGAPTRVIVDFFERLDSMPARVLDVGCGQGRDAMFIGRLGHSVVGVDISPNGIRDLTTAAAAKGLAVEGVIAGHAGVWTTVLRRRGCLFLRRRPVSGLPELRS